MTQTQTQHDHHVTTHYLVAECVRQCGDDAGQAWLDAMSGTPVSTLARRKRLTVLDGHRTATRRGNRLRRLAEYQPSAAACVEHEPVADNTDATAALVAKVLAMLGQLGECMLAGWSVADAAELCGISTATAYRRLDDVRRKLG